MPRVEGGGDVEYPSVTTVLSGLWMAGLTGWAVGITARSICPAFLCIAGMSLCIYICYRYVYIYTQSS